MPLADMWPLTQAWYGNRLDPGYVPASAQHHQDLLAKAGLTGPFWQLD